MTEHNRYVVRAGIFNGRLRFYVWDEVARSQVRPATSKERAEEEVAEFAKAIAGELTVQKR